MVDRTQSPRRIDEPEPCWMKMRLVKRGPFVAARIYMALGHLSAQINGATADVDHVWTSGTKIEAHEYMALRDNPPANPDQPIDLNTVETF